MRTLLAALLLAGCAYDPGGRVDHRAAYLAQNPAPSVIRGACESACTMRIKRDCVAPDAVLMFHGPYSFPVPLPERHFDHWSRVMADHYAPPMADWFMVVGRHGEHYFTGSELLARGWARSCP
jgi:hypothetical protein